MILDEPLAALRTLDWDDLHEVETLNGDMLATIAGNRDLLHQAVQELPASSHLLALCEHYDILDKLVLYDEPRSGYRVRLHVFRPGYFDRPHNHRWSYSSRLLVGGYVHTLYGTDDQFGENVATSGLRPVLVRTERTGSTYTLDHRMVHAVTAEPFTVSLVIRGPARKRRFLVADRVTKRVWWQYGAQDESQDEAVRKRLTMEQLERVAAKLGELNVFG